MIEVSEVLRDVPRFETFCSVQELHQLVDRLRRDEQFQVRVAGTSVGGLPIHHVQFGRGSVKALFVAYPHPNEPIGGLTVFSLLKLLRERNRSLVEADIEWHIVPCIDPDGARLNEGWSQKEFTLRSYMTGFHRQELRHQVECSFPINYKRLIFNEPIKETAILQGLLSAIQPDFYYSLHNNFGTGGGWFLLTRDIGQEFYRQLYDLLAEHGIPLKVDMPYGELCAQFAPGIKEPTSMKKYYDFMERTLPCPEQSLQSGGCSWDYLAEIKPAAMTFVAELPYLKHPSDGSKEVTTTDLRQLKLQMDAENKFVATVMLEEWEKVEDDLASTSPFYKKVLNGVISAKDTLQEGLPSWPAKTRDILFNPAFGKLATEGERFDVYVLDRFIVLCHSYEFVRLLAASMQTPSVKAATERLQCVLDRAIDAIDRGIDFSKFEVIDYRSLARAQLGSGLTVINALLEARGKQA